MKYYSLRFGSGDPRPYTGMSPTMLIFVNMTNGATVAPPSITEALTGSGVYQFQWGTTTPISFLADAATTSPGTSGRYVSGQLDPLDRMDEIGTTLVAIGTTNVALGTTNVALGTTLTAIGTSNIALGTSNFAIGTSITHYLPNHIGATLVGTGNTLFAIGTTNFALGTTNFAIGTSLSAQSSSLLAQGNTILSYLSGLSSPLLLAIGSTASSFGATNVDPIDLYGYLKRVQENLEGNNNFVKNTGVLSIYSRGSSTLLATKTIANSATTVIKT